MAASSLLSPNLISSNPKSLNLSSPLLSKQFIKSTFSCNSSVLSISVRKAKRHELGFVRRVAVTSEYEQGEEVSNGGGRENFSSDLKLFVGNLPFSVESADLAGLFDNAGTVEMVEVIYDKETGRSRGFGFVTMSTPEEVEAAAQQFNGYEFQGRALRVNYGPPPPREERAPRAFRSGGGGGGGGGGASNFDAGSRLYVGNLSWGVDNLALETLFSEQGRVTDARVVIDRDTGRSRGFGFVTFSSADEANNAISSLDGSDLDGRTIRVSMAEARPPRREF